MQSSHVDRTAAVLDRHWRPLLVAAIIGAQSAGLLFAWFRGITPTGDALFFQHAGWYITQGAVPYVDFWDVKPPVIYAISTVLALFSFGNMGLLYALSVITNLAFVSIGVYTVGATVYELTDQRVAALTAGLSTFLLPGVYGLPAYGLRVSFVYIGLISLTVYFSIARRHETAAVTAALGTLTYYPVAAVAVAVVGHAYTTDGPRASLRAVGVGLLTATLVLAPVALAGAAPALLTQTVLAPLVTSSGGSVILHLEKLFASMGLGVVGILLAVVGWRVDFRGGHWWTLAAAALLLKILLLDMESATDAMLLIVFVGLGVGMLSARRTPSRRLSVLAVVCVLIVLAGVTSLLIPYPGGDGAPTDLARSNTDLPSMEEIYWGKLKPDRCHYRLSGKEMRWISQTDASLFDKSCRTQLVTPDRNS